MKFRIISRLTGATRPRRADVTSAAIPNSVGQAVAAQGLHRLVDGAERASAAAYFAMFAASPAPMSSPASYSRRPSASSP